MLELSVVDVFTNNTVKVFGDFDTTVKDVILDFLQVSVYSVPNLKKLQDIGASLFIY
tara:strand:+ start:319 stop:489 length:171 start_codon:yes stop_codon:yes gene_type:complete